MLKKYYSFLDQGLVSGGNFLTVALCAHFLPLEEQGKFIYVFSSYIGLVLLNVSGVFQAAAIRAPSQGSHYQSQLALLQLFSAIFFSFLVAIFWFLFGSYFGWTLSLIDLGLVFVFFLLQQLADFSRRCAYIFHSVSRATFSSGCLYPARILLIALIQPISVDSVLLILIITAIFPASLTMRLLGQCFKNSYVWFIQIKEHLNYSRLFIAGSLIGWLWSYTPVFILGIAHGKAAAALLASIRGISGAANIFMEQLETKAIADWSRLYHREGTHQVIAEIKNLNRIAFVFWLFVMIVIYLFDDLIVKIILGNIYIPYAYVLDIAWIGYGAFYLARVHGIKQRTFGNNKIEFISNAGGLIAAISGSWLLIPSFSIQGAAWVYFIIPLIVYLIQLVVSRNAKYKK